jgi:hypothetical protein
MAIEGRQWYRHPAVRKGYPAHGRGAGSRRDAQRHGLVGLRRLLRQRDDSLGDPQLGFYFGCSHGKHGFDPYPYIW